jgi:hypothetical protein
MLTEFEMITNVQLTRGYIVFSSIQSKLLCIGFNVTLCIDIQFITAK